MKSRAILLALFLPLAALAQETGIAFESGSWKQVVAKAKAENKLIFLDTYTTWCGPCKWMDKNVYPDAKVGQKFNAAFINYKIDAEKGEGITLAKKYQVTAYPTYLFVSADESLVYRTIGSRPAAQFIEEADKAVEAGQGRSIGAYEADYAAGKRDAVFLSEFLQKKKTLGYNDSKLLDEYLSALPADSLLSAPTFALLVANPPRVGTKAFNTLADNLDKIRELHRPVGQQKAQMALQNGILASARAAIKEKDRTLFDQALAANTKFARRPQDALRLNDDLTMDFYKATKDLDKYAESTRKFLATYVENSNLDSLRKLDERIYAQVSQPYLSGKKDSTSEQGKTEYDQIKKYARAMNTGQLANQYNRAAWGFYETVSDKKQLQDALGWSKRSLDITPGNTAFIDTYAHLLYKLGQNKEALQWQQKAIDLAEVSEPEGVKGYEETLQKMKNKTL
ncbi:MAG: thioredoxin family protein [Cytophagaceae bacterium]|nr:thioredoxin family protein [Cytophagaceae bacterium]